jgi:hypothetical protein
MIKIYAEVQDKKKAAKLAKDLGISKVNSDIFYQLYKLGAKKSSSRGYPDSFEVIEGKPFLVSDGKVAWIYFENVKDWFKTSPILSFSKTTTGFQFETENSFYKMIPCIYKDA